MPELNCDVTCKSHGLVCSERGLSKHNSEVDSSDEVIYLITHIGGHFSKSSCNGRFGDESDVPSFKIERRYFGECFHSKPRRELQTFDCSATPLPSGGGKKRLCYCDNVLL